jgi:hypothetical protein
MPQYEFTSPEGTKYRVTGPEGSTKEQAFEVFKQQRPELFGGTKIAESPYQQKVQNAYSTSTGAIDPMSGVFIPGISQEKINKQAASRGTAMIKQAPIGTGLAVAGAIGDILNLPRAAETLGRAGLQKAGVNVSGEPAIPEIPIGTENFERVLDKIIGKPKTDDEKIAREIGKFFGPGLFSKGVKSLIRLGVGATTARTEDVLKAGEDLGFRFEPAQAREAEPTYGPGFASNARSNQNLANRYTSKIMGAETNNFEKDYLAKRFKEARQSYDSIFNKPIQGDSKLIQDLQDIKDFEAKITPADVRKLTATANNIIDQYNTAAQNVGGKVTKFMMDGRVFKELRDDLAALSRSNLSGKDAVKAGEFVDLLDGVIERSNPQDFLKLQDTNKKYAALKAVEESGAIDPAGNISLKTLGDYLDKKIPGFGRGTETHPLDTLGKIGVTGNLTSLSEGFKKGSTSLSELFNRFGRIATIPLRTQAARDVQRQATEEALRGYGSLPPSGTYIDPLAEISRQEERR